MSNLISYQTAIGNVLRAERERRGTTLRDLSDTVYISLGYLSEIERGKKEPSLAILDQLCDTLGLDLGEVMHQSIREVKQTRKELVTA
jgi:transcriptional regulator with XRE-family HTH domain